MGIETQFEIAVAAVAKLEQLHSQFMQQVAALNPSKIEGAELSVNNGELRAVCLGVPLQTIHRPVVSDGHLMSVEYGFRTKLGDEEFLVCAMYLEANGNLYSDSVSQELICQSGNTYLPQRLAPWLAASLLQSKVFAASK